MSKLKTDSAVSPWVDDDRKNLESSIDFECSEFLEKMKTEYNLNVFQESELQITVIVFEVNKCHISAVGRDYRSALSAAVNRIYYGAPIRYVGMGKFGLMSMAYWDCDKEIAYKYANKVKKNLG